MIEMNINQYLKVFLIVAFFSACNNPGETIENTETEEWQSLFNGKDLTGWEPKIAGYELNDNFKNTFLVEDSMIRINYNEYNEFNDAFGHMYYKKSFSYYRLRFDYRFTGEQLPGGASWNVRNSGIMLHSQSAKSNELGQGFPVSVEFQLLGGLSDGKERTTANVCTPGTAVEMGDTVNYTHCIPSTSDTYDGDRWVSAEAIVMGGEYMIFLVEGDTVLEFQKPQIGGGYISRSDTSQWGAFGINRDKDMWLQRDGEVLTEGYIALQAESHPIDFKNIELLDLCGCMDPKAKNYKSYYVQNKPEHCKY